MKKVLYFSACLLAFFSCEKKSNVDPVEPAQKETLPVRISPVITKVTETTFETGDAIGVSIVRSNQETYASNEKLVFDGSVFSGSLMWYAEGTDPASIDLEKALEIIGKAGSKPSSGRGFRRRKA